MDQITLVKRQLRQFEKRLGKRHLPCRRFVNYLIRGGAKTGWAKKMLGALVVALAKNGAAPHLRSTQMQTTQTLPRVEDGMHLSKNATHETLCEGTNCMVARSSDVGVDNDFCLENPSACTGASGNEGIGRVFMPQIRYEDGKFKVERFIKMVRSANPTVDITRIYNPVTVEMDIDKLTPIQKEGWRAKISSEENQEGKSFPGMVASLKRAERKEKGGGKQFAQNVFNKKPIIVATIRDGRILVVDGHHRYFSFKKYNEWARGKRLQTIKTVPAHVLDLTQTDMSAFDIVRMFHESGSAHKDLIGRSADVVSTEKM